MKKIYSLVAIPVAISTSLALSGCGSSEEPTVSPAQRQAQQAAALKAIPPQAQQGATQFSQQKSQMDVMRAKSAAAAKQP